MLLNKTLTTINTNIEAIQSEIAALQAKLAEMQQHAQAVQSAEAAGESAIVQVRTALQMIQAVSPDDVATFKAAINAVFGSDAPIIAPQAPEPVAPTPTPNRGIDNISERDVDDWTGVEVEVVAESEIALTATAVLDPESEAKPETEHLMTYMELMEMTSEALKRLAKAKGVDGYRRMTKDQIAQTLQDSVPAGEVKQAKPQN